MLVSTQYKFIFIKTRKTAGTSMEILLSKYCEDPRDIVTPLVPVDEAQRKAVTSVRPKNYTFSPLDWLTLPTTLWRQRHLFRNFDLRLVKQRYWNHVGGRVIKARLDPAQWTYLKFTIERDPWDKMISCYYWLHDYLKVNETQLSFRDFFEKGWAEWLSDFNLYTENGTLLVDRIINYDHLQAGLTAVAQELNLPDQVRLDRGRVNAKATPSAKKKMAADLFVPDLERKGRLLFAREIELFGFRDSPHEPKTLMDPYLFPKERG